MEKSDGHSKQNPCTFSHIFSLKVFSPLLFILENLFTILNNKFTFLVFLSTVVGAFWHALIWPILLFFSFSMLADKIRTSHETA